MLISREFEMRVWYVDTDQMGIVHHSNYIRYYEAARSDFMRSLSGFSYAEMERRGIMMPVLEVQSKYFASAHFDDVIRVKVSIDEIPRARIHFNFEVHSTDGKLLNSGYAVLGFMHSDTRRPTRAPQWFVDLLVDGGEGVE